MLCAGSGCVQQDKYDDTVLSNRTLKEQLVAAQRDRDAADANVRELREQLAQARTANSDLEAEVTGLNADLDAQARKYDELLMRVSRLEFGPLPVELEDALDSLAAAYPDLLTFDANRGLLRFSSDFTFDLGSAAVKPDAAATIATLADILNSPEAAPFELRVIGHTDNVPVERPRTKQLHPTNVHLSVHRAISVRDALVEAAVEPARVQVAGYGEFRPIVPNGPKGAAENRRVELLLVPMRKATAARDLEAEPPPALDEPMK
jgi:chemotaxis protein MotB